MTGFNFTKTKGLLVSSLLLMSCQAQPVTVSLTPQTLGINQKQKQIKHYASTRLPYLAIDGNMQVEKKGNHVDLHFNIHYGQPAGFKTQELDCGNVIAFQPLLSGIAIGSPIYADGTSGPDFLVNTNTDCSDVSFTISNVTFGEARVIALQAYRQGTSGPEMVPGGIVKAAFDLNAGGPANVEISFRQTPSAEIIEGLTGSNPVIASRINLTALQTLIDAVTGQSGTFPNYTFTTHPSLVDSPTIVTDLLANGGDPTLLSPVNPAYIQTARTLDGSVDLSSFTTVDNLELVLRDPASNKANYPTPGTSQAYSLNTILPGIWNLESIAQISGQDSVSRKEDSFDLSSGNLTGQTIDFSNVPYINTFSPGAGAEGATITVNGSGFTGLDSVKIGGMDVSNLNIVNNTQLTFDLPTGFTANPINLGKSSNTSSAHTLSSLLKLLGTDVEISTAPAGANKPFAVGGVIEEGARIAYNSTEQKYLVIWPDDRGPNFDFDIHGRILDNAGVPLGSDFVINTGDQSGEQALPDLAYNPTANEFLVVWSSDLDGIGFGGNRTRVKARRFAINGGGTGLDPVGAIADIVPNPSPTSEDHYYPAVAYNSTDNQYLVVWESEPGNLFGQRLQNNGGVGITKLDNTNTGFTIASTLDFDIHARVAYDNVNNQYLVVWERDPGTCCHVMAQIVSNTGILGNLATVIPTPNKHQNPDVVFDGSGQYFIVWEDNRSGWEVYGKRFSTDGVNITEVDEVPVATSGVDERRPKLAFNSANNTYMTVFGHKVGAGNFDIYSQAVKTDPGQTAANALIGSNTVLTADTANQRTPHLAFNSTTGLHNFLVGWKDKRNAGEENVYGQVLQTAP